MTYVSRALPGTVVGVGFAESADALSVIKEPSCAAAVWPRTMPMDVETWLQNLPSERLPQGRVVMRPNAVADGLKHLCDIAGTPQCDARDWFQADVVRMAELFANLMSVEYLRVRLDVVKTNACRKFHVDAVTARLVCTYRGSGTQYGVSSNEQDPQQIHEVAPGTPIVLRGTLWPTEPASGLLHRSPPIEGTGETRLLLVLDPIIDPEVMH